MSITQDWTTVADSAALEEGAMLPVTIGDRQLAVYRVEGKVYATDNICTHATALMTDGWLEGTIIECPLHGGRFDICTGKGLGAPITCDLVIHRVQEADGGIRVALTEIPA